MSVNVSVDGQPEFSVALHLLLVRQAEASAATVNGILRTIRAEERRLLTLGRHPPGTRTGSVPPAPPWAISGHLAERIEVDPDVGARRVRTWRWSGRVGPTAAYARIHELGGRTGRGHRTVLPPRPHLQPAWALVRPTMRHTFRRAWLAAQQI